MTLKRTLTLIAALVLILALSFASARAQGQGDVLVLTLDGPLTPALADYLARGITTAQRRGDQLVVVQLNTPGGGIETMQNMVSIIRSSPVPVVVYVYPRGAIAGSAGTVVTLAAHRSAMAPETAIGAATPVGLSGEELGESIRTKTEEIIKAQIRSLAAGRGEDAVRFAERTVDSGSAASAREALQVGLVDVLADNQEELLQLLDGEQVQMETGAVTLHTQDAEINTLSLSLIEQLLQLLTNPNILFILITIGAQALLIELSSPGGWFPGFVGAVCLALAGYGLGIIPVNWFGIIFLILAFVLFVLDIKAPTHGALTAAGVGSLITGALVLFNSPGTPGFQRVSIVLVIISSLLTGGVFALVTAFALSAQREPVRTGRESLIGRMGYSRDPIQARESGQVQVSGERWTAHLAPDSEPIAPGDRIEITAVSGNTVQVKKLERR